MRKINLFPEHQLLNRIKLNDRTVLGDLFIRYEKMVYKYVTAHGGKKADAEDMLQEALIVLWQNVCADKFNLTAKISTYILGIVKNKWRAETRKRGKFVDSELSDDTPDGNPTVLDTVVEKEKCEKVRMALNKMNPICKELLVLYYFEERSMQEISRIMGFANPNVVKAKKYQCKKSLEKILHNLMTEVERRI